MAARPIRPAAPWTAAALLATLAIAYRHFESALRDAFGTFYLYAPFDAGGIQTWRQPLLLDRIHQYTIFLPEVAVAALLFAVAFRWHAPLDAVVDRIARVASRVCAALLLLIAGALAVWLSTREWVRYRRPCWDGYCSYSNALLGVLRGLSPADAHLSTFLRTDYHCNSPLGPLLSALTSLLTRLPIVASYRLVCGLGSAGAIVLFHRFLARRGSSEIRLLQVLLLLTNAAVVRSFCFPQTDALVLLWSTAVLATAPAFAKRPTWRLRLLLLALGLSGVFVKLSFLPLLAEAPLCRAVTHFLSEKRARVAGAIRIAIGEGAILVGVPLAGFFLFQLLAGTFPMYRRELSMTSTLDFHPLFILEALCQAAVPAAVLVWLGRRALERDDLLLLLFTPLFLAALWISRGAGWSRYYLTLVPVLAMPARHGLERLAQTGRSLPWLFVTLTATLSYLALAQRIIH